MAGDAAGKLAKSAPQHVKKAFAKEIRCCRFAGKGVGRGLQSPAGAAEVVLRGAALIPLRRWRQYYVDHSLLGFLKDGR